MYELARAGIEFEIKSRETQIFSTKILAYNYPIIKLEITAAAGFYVRSFARDLGEILVGSGICQTLRRTHIEKISIKNPEVLTEKNLKPEKIPQSRSSLPEGGTEGGLYLIDPQKILTLKTLEIPQDRFDDFQHGRAFPIEINQENSEIFLLTINKNSIGLGELKYGKIHPKTLL